MKYDSSMKECHNEILAALRYMCSDNAEITEKFSPNDGSPAPLRDYLKQKHGRIFEGFGSSELSVDCHPTKGIKIDSVNLSEVLGEKLEMSWSQVASFIRNNWDAIFKGAKKKAKNNGLEVLVKTFDEGAITCPNWVTGKTLTYRERVKGVHFECKALSTEFGKLEDITRFFAQHCNLHEDCPYYKKSVSKNQPSPAAEDPAEADKPKTTYFDVLLEHYPNFDDEMFDEFVGIECIRDFFDDNEKEKECYNGNSPKSCEECWKSECKYPWRLTADGEANVMDYLKEPDESVKTADLPPVPANAEENTALFDYSEFDNDTAQNLRECENVIRQKTAGYFTLLGEKFKEAQTLLANHSSGTFEKWYTALGFKRQTVYNLIQRYDFLSSPTLEGHEDTFEALPLTLSYEVSKPDAPKELVEKVIEGDITTNAEYIKLKKELERTQEECRQIDANSAAKDKEYQREIEEANKRAEDAESQARTYQHNYLQMNKNFDVACENNVKLEKRIKELESQPIDVVVQQDESVLEELEQLREENARLKDSNIKNMIIRITLDDFEQLLELTKNNVRLYAAVSKADIIKV